MDDRKRWTEVSKEKTGQDSGIQRTGLKNWIGI